LIDIDGMAKRVGGAASRQSSAPPIPRPGAIFCPIGRALDLIGDRWTLVLLRHFLSGPKGFQEMRQRTGIAPRVLSSRLRQMVEDGFIEPLTGESGRSGYAVTERGRTLEPIVAAIARWWVDHAMEDHAAMTGGFTETSPQSILESLPFLLHEDRARDVDRTFEIRLTGTGGGVWTVRICDGECRVEPRFAERADVRYTAEASTWCAVALGMLDAHEALEQGLMTKDGGRDSLDRYFHQIGSPPRRSLGDGPAEQQRSTP
jgi:DNA-binding HxlR family transcriptional regulator